MHVNIYIYIYITYFRLYYSVTWETEVGLFEDTWSDFSGLSDFNWCVNQCASELSKNIRNWLLGGPWTKRRVPEARNGVGHFTNSDMKSKLFRHFGKWTRPSTSANLTRI